MLSLWSSCLGTWDSVGVVLWNACMVVVVVRPLNSRDMEPIVKFMLTITAVHVSFSCVSIGLGIEFILGRESFCQDNLQQYLQIVIISANLLNLLVVCIGIGYILTHIGECPIANASFLSFPLPRTPTRPRPPPIPQRQYSPAVLPDMSREAAAAMFQE